MNSILACFANDEKFSLQSLDDERRAISGMLDIGNSKNHFTFKEIAHATSKNVIAGIRNYHRSLHVFLFSGHAGKDRLELVKSKADAEGIAMLLALCPNLDLIILNGCSTIGQVAKLLDLPSQPAVVATSAPVEDFSASQFSISFFRALVEEKMLLKQAFDFAIGELQVEGNKHAKSTQEIRKLRELVSVYGNENKGIWGLFIPENRKYLAQWRMPNKPEESKETIPVIPNTEVNGDGVIIVHKVKGNVNTSNYIIKH